MIPVRSASATFCRNLLRTGTARLNLTSRQKRYSGLWCSFHPGARMVADQVLKERETSTPSGGKEITMLGRSEQRLAELEAKIAKMGFDKKQQAIDILRRYRCEGRLSPKQWQFVEGLTAEPRRKPSDKSWALYAISDRMAIKIGVTTNLARRVAELQTGSHQELEVVWSAGFRGTKASALQAERKLHRFCRKHHIRGEWFDRACLERIEEFRIKPRQKENRP